MLVWHVFPNDFLTFWIYQRLVSVRKFGSVAWNGRVRTRSESWLGLSGQLARLLEGLELRHLAD